MQENVLNSVINLTKTRDVNSLEYSLVTTLHEFVQCNEVAVYKDLQNSEQRIIERSLSLNCSTDKKYHWEDNVIETDPDDELISCLKSACIITVQNNQGIESRWLPISLFDKPVVAIKIVGKPLTSNQQVLLNAFCRIYENYLTILNENERDKLTGLLNRQTFENKFKKLLEKQIVNRKLARKSKDLSKTHPESTAWLAMVDIDHFKDVNDTYGHVCGDEVLLILAQQMRGFFRATDLMFRFGGEEFVMLFEPSLKEDIRTKLELFIEHIRTTTFPFITKLTLSIGVTKVSPYDYPINVLENADKALYFAKENGRDQMHFFEELMSEGRLGQQGMKEANQGDIDLF
ncbi:GGDEF domain-containing protein [Pseudoalteromonas sp. SSDWG2]|uniref:GGDEF domain-containing protein n=1 Tax=Pseudoalteromonas sp. SSDWG2 TaxID=3139391 RepID=UPI003BAB2694